MSENSSRKLRLNKNTVRTLSEDSLDQVAGGNGDTAGIICVFSILIICGDSIICSVAAGFCDSDNGD